MKNQKQTGETMKLENLKKTIVYGGEYCDECGHRLNRRSLDDVEAWALIEDGVVRRALCNSCYARLSREATKPQPAPAPQKKSPVHGYYGICAGCGQQVYIDGNDSQLCSRCLGEDAEWIASLKNPFGNAEPRDILDAVRQAHPDHLN